MDTPLTSTARGLGVDEPRGGALAACCKVVGVDGLECELGSEQGKRQELKPPASIVSLSVPKTLISIPQAFRIGFRFPEIPWPWNVVARGRLVLWRRGSFGLIQGSCCRKVRRNCTPTCVETLQRK